MQMHQTPMYLVQAAGKGGGIRSFCQSYCSLFLAWRCLQRQCRARRRGPTRSVAQREEDAGFLKKKNSDERQC